MFCKIINGKLVLPPHNDGNKINVHLDPQWCEAHGFTDMTVAEINAAKAEWNAAHPDRHDWRDKEKFIAAVKTLIPADKLVEILGDAAKLKESVAGLALLATDAAPGGLIDVNDSRVAQFLALSGLTVEQVLEAMK